jgi:hypothetical protein
MVSLARNGAKLRLCERLGRLIDPDVVYLDEGA